MAAEPEYTSPEPEIEPEPEGEPWNWGLNSTSEPAPSSVEPEPEIEPEPEKEPEPETEGEPWNWALNGTSEPEPPGAEPEPGFGPDIMVVLTVLAVLIIVTGTVGNLLVIVVISRMKKERTLTEIFLTSLAIADLIVCMLATPLLVVGIIEHQGHTGISYQVEQFLFYFSSVASILNLTSIAIDRYDAVLHPMSRRLTKTNIKWVLLAIWAIAFLAALIIHFIPPKFELFVLAPFFCVPLVVMIVCYRRILKTAKKSEKAALKRELAGKDDQESNTKSKIDKTVRMVIIVVVVFALSWIPSLISRLLKYTVEMSPANLAGMEVSACLIAYAGSALNFIVYACMSRRFQVGLMELIRCQAFSNKVGTENSSQSNSGKTATHTVNLAPDEGGTSTVRERGKTQESGRNKTDESDA